ncbi:hypothetical protein RRG08_063814 [Elysia crispata]|uniref:Uncharacterized protein n=1 Tax=Elysia crispata TaxID=231223 RepID=A0AAE1E0B4_9GAST|nr:hypothetical protein RRG08_063814 [Elysia crispata]
MFKSRTRNCLWDLFPSLQQGVFLESEVNRVVQGMIRERFKAVRFSNMSTSRGKTSFSVTKIRLSNSGSVSVSVSGVSISVTTGFGR